MPETREGTQGLPQKSDSSPRRRAAHRRAEGLSPTARGAHRIKFSISISPRRRASPCLAEGLSPTARGAHRIKFSISISPRRRASPRIAEGLSPLKGRVLGSDERFSASLRAFAPHPPNPLLPQGEKGEFGHPEAQNERGNEGTSQKPTPVSDGNAPNRRVSWRLSRPASYQRHRRQIAR